MASGGTQVSTGVVNNQLQQNKSYPQWEYYLLKSIGAPQGPAQLDALNLWARSEGMPATTNNWLAITDSNGEFGATGGLPQGALATGVWNYQKDGKTPLVVTFASLSNGVSAISSFLQHGHTGIIDALKNPNATVETIATAIQKDGAWGNDGNVILGNIGAPIYHGGTSTGKTADTTTSTFTQCNSNNSIIGYGGIVAGVGKFSLLNPCQAKALVGGLTIGLGGIIFGAGLFIISANAVKTLGLNSITSSITDGLRKSQQTVLGGRSATPQASTTTPTVSTPAPAAAPSPKPTATPKPEPEGMTFYTLEPRTRRPSPQDAFGGRTEPRQAPTSKTPKRTPRKVKKAA